MYITLVKNQMFGNGSRYSVIFSQSNREQKVYYIYNITYNFTSKTIIQILLLSFSKNRKNK